MSAYKIHSIYTSIIICVYFMSQKYESEPEKSLKLTNGTIKDEWECAEEQKWLNWRRGSMVWGSGLISLFVLTHTHCGLIVLLQDGGHISRLLLFLLRVVLNQRRPLGGSAPSFLSRSARRQTSVSSSFAVVRPAAECPAAGTGLAGQLSAAGWSQRTQSERVGQVHVVQAVAPGQAVSALQGREEITRGQSVLFWRLLWGGLITEVSASTCRVNLRLKQNPWWIYPIFVIVCSPEGEECQHVTKRWKDTGTPWTSRAAPLHHAGCPALSRAPAVLLRWRWCCRHVASAGATATGRGWPAAEHLTPHMVPVG